MITGLMFHLFEHQPVLLLASFMTPNKAHWLLFIQGVFYHVV